MDYSAAPVTHSRELVNSNYVALHVHRHTRQPGAGKSPRRQNRVHFRLLDRHGVPKCPACPPCVQVSGATPPNYNYTDWFLPLGNSGAQQASAGAGPAREGSQAELWIFRAQAPCSWPEAIPPPHLMGTWRPFYVSGRPGRVNEHFSSLASLSRAEGVPPAGQVSGALACWKGSCPEVGSVGPLGSALPGG